VHITGPGTGLTFSNEGIAPSCSEHTISHGEIFTCPIRDSVNGTSSYNAENAVSRIDIQQYQAHVPGRKVVEAEAGGGLTGKLNDILDADEGARYIGEWSLAFHPHILKR